MGLSTEERYSGLMYSVHMLVKTGEMTPAYKFTSRLWHALLGDNHNSSHWVFGSASSGDIKIDGKSVWERAMCHHTCCILDGEKEEIPHAFDATDNFSIPLLVRYGENRLCERHKKMFDIYQWTEDAIYYLRRYDDEMPKEFSDLNKLISDIQGECYSYFKDNEVFAKAYIVNKIIIHLYAGTYPYQKNKWNILVQWLEKNNVHHDLNRCMEMELKDLAQIHVDLVRDKSIKNKVITIGKIMLRRLHKYRDDPFMKKYISKDMFSKAEKMYQEHEKTPSTREQSELSLYGWGYYNDKI